MSQDKIEDLLIVYKDRLIDEDKGIVKPVLVKVNDREFRTISAERYPSGIYISRGYSEIEDKYKENELFILNSHYFDETSTNNAGAPRYWSEGNREEGIPQNLLIPIIKEKLPPVSSRALPLNCRALSDKLFFIYDESQGIIYGPLTVVDTDHEGRQIIGAKTISSISIGKDYLAVFKYEDIRHNIVNINLNGGNHLFITSLEDISGSYDTENFIDYMSDSDLIKYFNDLGSIKSKKFLTRNEASKLKEGILNFEKSSRVGIRVNERLNRLKTIIDLYLEETVQGSKLIEDFFESNKGKDFLASYVEKNEAKLISDQIKKIEEEAKNKELDIKQKISLLESSLNKKKEEIENINTTIKEARDKASEEINDIKAEKEETIRRRLKETEEELQVEIEELEKKKEENNNELNNILSRLKLANDIREMTDEKEYLEQHNKRLDEASKSIQRMLREPDELAKRMGEFEIVSRVLRGDKVSKDSNLLFTPITNFSSYEPSSGSELIDAIRSSLDEDVGRKFSKAEMANLLICLTQSFLTVLAGPPGVGKTSSIVRLAKALNLGSPSDYKNFLYMSVARGWVSGRDILGFYNSLNNTYQRARTGLFDFLGREEEQKDSLQLILLDEANLSPLEHYWSDFLGMCDKEGRDKPIQTGIPDDNRIELIVKKNVRFVATINHDSTTERLSPRLIDRVPIISLEHDLNDSVSDSPSLEDKLDGAINYDLFEKFFTKNDAELNTEHKNKLNRIIELLGVRDPELGQSINISYRKIEAITNYYGAAVENELMESDTAFDFSIAQHVLPHIEGYGPKFQKRLIELKKELGPNYSRSFNHLERILAAGSDFTSTYSFF